MTEQPAPEAWRTDPRERLLAAIDSTWAYGELGTTPEQLVDDFAHHLAQQQRALADANDELDHDHHRYVFSPAVREVADLIDPKAQRASTEGDTP